MPTVNSGTSVVPEPIQTGFICSVCNVEHELDDGIERPDRNHELLCLDCFNDEYYDCDICGETERRLDTYSVRNGDRICQSCYDDNYFTCENCDDIHHNDDASEDNSDLCVDCAGSRETGMRHYDSTDMYVEVGKRAYAVEIECFPQNDRLAICAKNMPKEVGITEDGSLHTDSSYAYGREIITPKMSGQLGKDLLKTICSELLKAKSTVNKSCGLHVHIDMTDYINQPSIELIKLVFLFYLAFEPVLFSYLPMSRRKNRYCLALSEFYHETEIVNARDREYLEALWYRDNSKQSREERKRQKYDNSRYAGINFHSLFSKNNIEIRYHSGTIDHNKIDMWVKLHVAIIDTIASGIITREQIQDIKYLVDMKQKQEKLFELVPLPANVKAYFLDRQEKFGIISDSNKNICAE